MRGDAKEVLASQIVTYQDDDNVKKHLLFGAVDDGNVYAYEVDSTTFTCISKYPNNFNFSFSFFKH